MTTPDAGDKMECSATPFCSAGCCATTAAGRAPSIALSTTRFWASAIAMDALVFAALISGLLGGSHFALNAALFFCWSYAGLIWIVVFGLSQQDMLPSVIGETRRRMCLRTSWKVYDIATDLLLPMLLAGFGYFILAGLLLFGQIFLKNRIYAWVEEQNAKDGATQAPPEN